MPSPYPTFRELAAICRNQAARRGPPDVARLLLELARDYEAQAEAEEAFRRGLKAA
jgi:hypothetical protein